MLRGHLTFILSLMNAAADKSFVDGLVQIGNSHHKDMQIDVCRCYHFGPKFLVEIGEEWQGANGA